MQNSDLWVDNDAHLLHLGGRTFPCDRDVEALLPWKEHALLLSSDTDCLSLWDRNGLVRLTRVGVYPQDVAAAEDTAVVCGGADGRVYRLTLPDLRITAEYPLPGMPERICLQDETAHILILLTEPGVHTALLTLNLQSGQYAQQAQFPGIPGAIAADEHGLWIGLSELVLHLPYGKAASDLAVFGFGLPRRIEVLNEGVAVFDELEERTVYIRT